MTSNTSNTSDDSTGQHSSIASDGKNTRQHQSASDEAWSRLAASHRQVQRVEDTLEVAHACMDQVQVRFFTGIYTPRETVALGAALLDWADMLHRELATLRQAHQANVDAWLNSSQHIA